MTDYTLVNGDNRTKAMAALAGRDLALDVETVRLYPWHRESRLRMVQLAADPRHTWIFLDPSDDVRQIIHEATALVGHNLSFDLQWIDAAGLGRIEDTFPKSIDTHHLAHYHDNRPVKSRWDPEHDEWDDSVDECDDADAVGHGLKALAVHHLGPEADRAERDLYVAHNLPTPRSQGWAAAWAAIPDNDPHLLQYAADDPGLVWRILPFLEPRDGEVALLEHERQVAQLAAGMQQRGYRVDLQQVEATRAACQQRLDELLPPLAAVGITSLSLGGAGKAQAVAALLDSGAVLTKRTPSGEYSLSRDVLEGLTPTSPIAANLHQARRNQRFLRDYLPKMAINRGLDGRLHPSIRTLAARTGRWTVDGALPLHQMPRVGGLRECLVADPGNVLVAADYRSIEFHVLGALTEDPAMLAITEAGDDPYLATAHVVFPDAPWDKIGAEARTHLRNAAKPFCLALGYGQGAATLAARTGRTLGEARAMHHRLKGAWQGPALAMRRVKERWARGDRTVRSPFGRTYWIPEREGRPLPHVMVNNLTQGTARDLMQRDLLRVQEAGLRVWLTVHDEVIVECPQADAEEALTTLTSVMTHRPHDVLGIPIQCAGVVLGNAWRKA